MQYLILQNPGHNRVYYNVAAKLALAELEIAGAQLTAKCLEISIVTIEDLRYISLETQNELSEEDMNLVSRLSFVFAIFELQEIEGQKYLKPLRKIPYEVVDGKISSLLKYQGKTNELFTKMMLNVAVMSSDFAPETPIQLLDPVAGKGTTLFEGAIYGFDSFGIEIEPKSVQELTTFFKKFLQEERYKHALKKRQISGAKKADATNIAEFEYAASKEAFKNPENVRKLGIVGGNSSNAASYFKGNTFHTIVGDLPYGIFHGNSSNKKGGGTRNPSELLNECLPGWFKVLKKGGTCVVAWNSFLVSRQKLAEVFEKHGFSVLNDEVFSAFEHRVDKSIKRDILVAKKK